MSTDATPAGSSPAAETPAAPPSFSAYQADADARDRAAFRPPVAPKPESTPDAPPADSSPATPAAQATATAVKPAAASEAAKPRKTAEDRIPELLADRHQERQRAERLERELAEVRAKYERPAPQENAKPVSTPAPATFPSYDDWTATNPDASYEEYLDARADFRADQRFEARQQAEQERTAREHQTKEQRDTFSKFSERMKAATAADPAFEAAISEEVSALEPFSALVRDARGFKSPATGRYVHPGKAAIAEEILRSDLGPQLMRHFSDHPDDLARLSDLPPTQMFKEIGKLEARLTPADHGTYVLGAKPAKATPTKPVTDFPDPGTTLGKRPAQAADEAEAAVARGNFADYQLEADRRELARARRS